MGGGEGEHVYVNSSLQTLGSCRHPSRAEGGRAQGKVGVAEGL